MSMDNPPFPEQPPPLRRMPEDMDPQVVLPADEPLTVVLVEAKRFDLPHPGFWWSVLWSLGHLLATQILPAVAIVVIALVTIMPRRPNPADAERLAKDLQETVMGPAVAASQIAGVVFSLVVLRLVVGRSWAREIGLRRPSEAHIVLVLLGMPGFLLLPGIVAEWARATGMPTIEYQKELEKMFQSWDLWFGVLFIGLGPGLAEELWFRGFLGRGLVGRYGPVVGVVITSVFFGVMHMDPPHIVATTVMGLLLHFIYLTTRSLWMPILVHFLNNSTGVALTHAAREWPELKEFDAAMERNAPFIFVASAVLLAAVCYALYSSRVRLVPADDTDRPYWQPPFPGVAHPPEGSGTTVVRPWPGILAVGCVLGAVGLFVAAMSLILREV